MPNTRLVILFAAVSMLTACATPPPPAPAPAPMPASEPAAPVEPTPPPPPPPPAGPVSAAAQSQAHRMAQAAAELLEAGNEDQARAELQRALSTDPNSKLALSLMRQITTDPQTLFGRESFAYTVRPSDSLSLIARRFLGDVYLFYALARYNDIKVPRQVAGGQVLRIPGKAPPPGADREPPAPRPAPAPPPTTSASPAPAPAAPAPTPAAAPAPAPAEPSAGEVAMRNAVAAERSGDFDRAIAEYRRAAIEGQPGASAKADQVVRQAVSHHSGLARAAFAKQDLNGAIRHWDRVLQLDPGNDNARLERRKASQLKEKLEKM